MILNKRSDLEDVPGKRIAFFGGTFDPLHQGHVHVMEAALAGHVDRVVLCPHSHSPVKNPTPIADRIRIAEIVIADSRFRGSISIASPGLVHGLRNERFLETTVYLERAGREVWILAGTDSVSAGQGAYFQELGKLSHLIHLRENEDACAPTCIEGKVVFIPHQSTLSSSSIRESIALGGRHPSEKAHAYILEKGLYGTRQTG